MPTGREVDGWVESGQVWQAVEDDAEAAARIRSEAERLQSLTAEGRELEAITIALRIGRQSEESMDRLHSMDRESLTEYIERLDQEIGEGAI